MADIDRTARFSIVYNVIILLGFPPRPHSTYALHMKENRADLSPRLQRELRSGVGENADDAGTPPAAALGEYHCPLASIREFPPLSRQLYTCIQLPYIRMDLLGAVPRWGLQCIPNLRDVRIAGRSGPRRGTTIHQEPCVERVTWQRAAIRVECVNRDPAVPQAGRSSSGATVIC